MATDDQQNDGDGGGQHQADRSPQGGPETRCGDERNWRQASGLAKEKGLQDVPDGKFGHHNNTDRHQGQRPAVTHRHGDDDGEDRCQKRADVRHEAQHDGQDAPENRARNADHEHRRADEQAGEPVNHHLHGEQAAQPAAGLVQRGRGAVDIAGAGEPDQPVSQILAVEEDKGHHQNDDAKLGQGMNQNAQHRQDRRKRPGGRFLNLDRNGLCHYRAGSKRRLLGLEFDADFLKHIGGAFQRSTP